MAVGVDEPTTNSIPTFTLAEQRRLGRWSIEPTPNPADASINFLSAVSCPASSECVAVGYYTTVAGLTHVLVERWDGRVWTVEPAPAPQATDNSTLDAVSCPTVSDCIATGGYIDAQGDLVTLAERWAGHGWTVQATPNPAGSTNAALTAVSCPTTLACTAVGTQVGTAPGQHSLVERWNGSFWWIQPVPDPPGALSSFLRAVSCPTADVCTATGDYQSILQDNPPLAERWEAGVWQVQAPPSPAGEPVVSLSGGVSCALRTSCIAVGIQDSSASVQFPLAEGFALP